MEQPDSVGKNINSANSPLGATGVGGGARSTTNRIS